MLYKPVNRPCVSQPRDYSARIRHREPPGPLVRGRGRVAVTRRLLLRWIAGTATGSIDRYAKAEAEAEAEDAMGKRLDKYLETVWRHGRRWVALLYARTTG